MSINFVTPKWNAPSNVRALFTMRGGGASVAPFDSLNLSVNVGDDINAVYKNRDLVDSHLPTAAKYLRQIHSAKIIRATDITASDSEQADGMWTQKTNTICAITVADCAPIFIASADGLFVAAVHAGWRGLAAGIIENAAAKLRAATSPAAPFVAWIGPHICARHYPVGAELVDAFDKDDRDYFVNIGGRLCADIAGLARRRLVAAGAAAITTAGDCTHCEKQNYFSARRDGHKTGRMAAVIWRQ